MMRVTIKDLDGFMSHVFGAECFVNNFPDLQTKNGVEVKQLFKDGWYYIINPATGWYYHDTTFFTKSDMKFLKRIN